MLWLLWLTLSHPGRCVRSPLALHTTGRKNRQAWEGPLHVDEVFSHCAPKVEEEAGSEQTKWRTCIQEEYLTAWGVELLPREYDSKGGCGVLAWPLPCCGWAGV